MPVLDVPDLIQDRVEAISNYHRETGVRRAQVDVSGGIDSATILGLVARALGPDQITAVYSSIHSSQDSRDRARAAAAAFDVALVEIDLTGIFDTTTAAMLEALAAAGFDPAEIQARMDDDPTVLGSIRSCLRAPIGRGFNRMTGGGIRHGTGNECEDRFLRFYQKGGDGEVDTNPIAMLSKGEVYQLALGLGVPTGIVDALPTPDLHGIGDDHNDETELLEATGVPWSYSRVSAETGEYEKVGTIEQMSRLLDETLPSGSTVESALFGDESPWADENVARDLMHTAWPMFPTFHDDAIEGFLKSARKLEAQTRHKSNPNCPTLGTRAPLVSRGILTNELPLVTPAES